MAEQLKERKDMNQEFFWDLSTLFKSDEDWENAFAEIDKYFEELAAYSGKLNNAKIIAEFSDKMTLAERKLYNLYVYAHQRYDEDTRAEKAQGMFSRMSTKASQLVSLTAFAEPEILSLPDDKLKELLASEKLSEHKFNMEKLVRNKPHTLTEKEETLIARLSELMTSPGRIAGTLEDADLIFGSIKDEKGNEVELSGSNYILHQMSADRTLRKNAFDSYYKTFKEHINTFATTFSYNVKARSEEASIRKFNSSLEHSLFADNVPVDVYDSLIATVRKHLPDMYRYLALRKKILKLDELHYYDVYAPLSSEGGKKYSYDEAKELVLDAVSPLGEEYVSTVKSAFNNKWIDVYPNKGKRGGAYSSGTYDSNPYILLNFNGTLDSVSTLAHEMGHSIHSYLSHKNQPPQYGDYTIFVAEVASTVNENLMVELLLSKTSDPKERLALLNQYLENFKGTVFRQTMFAEFEKITHSMHEAGKALSPSALNEVYLNLIKDYFGEDLVIDDEVKYEWARIPHFYNSFYVYKYATGYSSAVALSEKIRNVGEEAVKNHLKFLSMGGSAFPIDELKVAGVDLTTPEPIDLALDKFAKVLDEAEKIAESL